jgi:pimeloyl-ACP methyl ester carboxylesterase
MLLHGYLGSGRNLWSLARAWTKRDPSRTLVLADLPGHGRSPPLTPGATIESMGRDVLETLRLLEAGEPATIVGHSLGGRVALAALGEDPAAVTNVELLDISPGAIGQAGDGHTRTAEAFARVPARFVVREDARAALEAQGLERKIVDWLLTNLVPDDGGFTWRVDRQALVDVRGAINTTDLWRVLEQYGRSVRCIRGELSQYVSDADAERMRSLGCEVTTLPGAGHFVHVDAPAALLDALLRPLPAKPE